MSHDLVNEILKDPTNTLPAQLNQLAACRVCALVKDREQFQDHGCNNCSHVEPLVWSAALADTMTTPTFSGVISMLRPTESWVAKWQFMKKNYVPGLYAIQVDNRITAKEAREEDEN